MPTPEFLTNRFSLFLNFLLSVVFMLLFCGKVFSQQKLDSENLIVVAYTNENGLRQSMVSQVRQDSHGLIWMVTGDGLHYFDGQHFRFFRVPYNGIFNQTDNVMRYLVQNQPGNFIIGSNSSILGFNTMSGKFNVIFRREGIYPVLFDYHISNKILAWIMGLDFCLINESGVSRIRMVFEPGDKLPDSFVPYKAIQVSPGEILVAGTEGLLSLKLKATQGDSVFLATWKSVPECTGLVKSVKGRIFLFANGILYSLNKTNTLKLITNTKIKSKPKLFVDSEDNIWLHDQLYNRLYRITSSGVKEVNLFNFNGTKTEILHPSITSIFEDKDQNLWFGTDGNGVLLYNPAKVQFQRADIGFTRCISQLKGKIWAGTFNNGLWELSPDLSKANQVNPLHFNNKIYFLDMTADHHGRMWIATRDGLEVTDDKGILVWRYPFKCLLAKFIPCMGDSVLLVADNDLFHFSASRIPKLAESKKFFAAKALLSIGDFYWVGVTEGLFRYKKSLGLTADKIPDPGKYKLNSVPVNSLVYSNGLIWAATGNGIQCYNTDGSIHPLPSCLQSLGNDVIYSIIPDKHSRFWITGNNGIGCVSPAENKMIVFGLRNNLQSAEFNYNACCAVGDDHIYFGGIQGINHINPNSFLPGKKTAEVRLISLFVSDTAYSACVPVVDRPFRLSRLVPNISGRVFTPDYLSDGALQYSFLLEGFESQWSSPTNSPDFSYRNLPPGNYRLLAKCADVYQTWSKPTVLFTFKISKPYYKTWWFLISGIAAIILITAFIVRLVQQSRYRTKINEIERQFAIEKERTRISKDMHDEVGASLTRISILSELAKKQKSDPAKAQQIIDQISEISGGVVDEMSEIIWAMNPRNDTLDSFTSYIRQYISTYLETVNIVSTFEFPEEIPSHFMSSELRRNLFLILKEALHNVVKHADATKVHTAMEFSIHNLSISIADNGKGFDEQNIKSWGNGLANMRKRMEESGGTFAIETGKMSGTAIRLGVVLGKR